MSGRRLMVRPRESHDQRYAPEQGLQAVQQQMRAHKRKQVVHPGEQDGIYAILSPGLVHSRLDSRRKQTLDVNYLAQRIPESLRRQRLFHRQHLIKKRRSLPDVHRERKHVDIGQAVALLAQAATQPRKLLVDSRLPLRLIAQDEERDLVAQALHLLKALRREHPEGAIKGIPERIQIRPTLRHRPNLPFAQRPSPGSSYRTAGHTQFEPNHGSCVTFS